MAKLKFLQQDTNRKKSLKLKWRRPKGIQSKLRLNKAGHGRKPSPGYIKPKGVRFTIGGKRIAKIESINDLDKANENYGFLLSSKIGTKKKILILQEAKKKGINLINIKNLEKEISKIEENLEKRKQEKKKKQSDKKKSKEKSVKEAEKKETKENTDKSEQRLESKQEKKEPKTQEKVTDETPKKSTEQKTPVEK